MGKDPDVLDRIIEEDAIKELPPRIRAIKTTETMEQDAMDAPLNEEERKEVDEEIALGKGRLRKLGRKGPTNIPGLDTQVAGEAPPATASSADQRPRPQPNQLFSQTQPLAQNGHTSVPGPSTNPSASLGGLSIITHKGRPRPS